MFRPMPEMATDATLKFKFDGRALTGRLGDTVAAALLANGIATCRLSPVSGAARGPYCMMGICFECLVVIDGVGNRQGCLVSLVDGMDIATQQGRRSTQGNAR
jgi:D-hydroxyproline dehydrogenase subunit gamma